MKDRPVESTNRPAARVRLDLFQPGLGILQIFTVEEFFEKLLLALEVQIDGSSAQARFLGNIAHGGLVVSQPDDYFHCHGENLIIGFISVRHKSPLSSRYAQISRYCV